jgi:hypothetical protein
MASAINAEFRELLIQELDKVDDRFFQVHDTSEDEIDELDATVIPYPIILTIVAQWTHGGRTRRMVSRVVLKS